MKKTQLTLSYLVGGMLISLAAGAAEEPSESLDKVIVTGTRSAGKTARQSLTPVDVIFDSDLRATGQTNLLDALKSILPSINTPAVGYDVGALARTFQLRGLSPSYTLILINGKRRHRSASLYADSDPAQGSNAVDLDFIPLAAIDHVEVLRDGAAAQYGTDAIAGVINVILKKNAQGGTASLSGGRYIDGGGATKQVDLESGYRLGDDGFLDLSASYRTHDFSNRSGDSGGTETAKVQGDPKLAMATLGLNGEKKISAGVSSYFSGFYGHRNARAYENPRQPGALSAAVDTLYPNGFSPIERISEDDFSATAGLKGTTAAGLEWSLSSTYGHNKAKLFNEKTINADLLNDTANKQRDFYVGSFTSSESTTNLDFKRTISLFGLASPSTLAYGLEHRHEAFRIGAGEANSYYQGGSAAFPGFRPSDQASAQRNVEAAYLDFGGKLNGQWEIGAAVRGERYNDVGNTLSGKLSSRYDVSDKFAIRGAISNGFHAPTLAQQSYSATTVTTGFAQIQLPVNSAGARLLGAPELKPETSRNLSAGFVFEPVRNTHLTVDAYRIDIKGRVIESASLAGAIAASAITANGSAIPAGVPAGNVSAAFFTNGVDTRTQGIDVVLDFRTRIDESSSIKWVLSEGYNQTTIRKIHAAPAALAAVGLTLVDAVIASNLTTAAPRNKVSLAGTYARGNWDVTLRETYYSNTSQVQGYAPGPYYTIESAPAFITDLSVGYTFARQIKLNIGANNLFNKYPSKIAPSVYQNLNYDQYSHVSPFGINGGYFYANASMSF